ncbi:REXO4 family protein [Megaselia abdita]
MEIMETSPKNENKPPNVVASISRKNAGQNWQNAAIGTTNPSSDVAPQTQTTNRNQNKKKKKTPPNNLGMEIVSIDCEMVGVGLNGTDDMLARVSIVNQKGEILLDKYVKPTEPVVDYRTKYSGIRPQDITNAEEFEKVQDEVIDLLEGKVIVGHAVHNDLRVLYIKHPFKLLRDTSKFKPLARLVGTHGGTPSLRKLTKALLGKDIQDGEHDSVEDARAAMDIYNKTSVEWEKYIKKMVNRTQQHRR